MVTASCPCVALIYVLTALVTDIQELKLDQGPTVTIKGLPFMTEFGEISSSLSVWISTKTLHFYFKVRIIVVVCTRM